MVAEARTRSAAMARPAYLRICGAAVGPEALLDASVAAVFAGAGDLRGVVVEITEQTPAGNYDALRNAIAPVRAAGALLAVDDAVAGFASLKHITVLRPDFDGGSAGSAHRRPPEQVYERSERS
jgi:predicted signal transduction protein with EAL and GGDEF domain